MVKYWTGHNLAVQQHRADGCLLIQTDFSGGISCGFIREIYSNLQH